MSENLRSQTEYDVIVAGAGPCLDVCSLWRFVTTCDVSAVG